MMRGGLIGIALGILGVAAPGTALPVPAPAPARVLFIGNSLTFANNLPAMVEALAGRDRVSCRVVAFPDFSLEDHWQRGDAVREIATGGWSTIVLQQGPSALPESRVLLVEYTKRFDAEAKRIGARTALYMVWPSKARMGDFDGVSASYTAAAATVGGLLLPVGDAWRAAWRRDANVALYGPDNFHPSVAATYLAALVIVERLTGRSPVGLPSTIASGSDTVSLPAATARLLQEAAADVDARVGRSAPGER